MLKKPKSSEIRKRGRAIEDDVMPEEVLCSLMSNKLGLQKSRRISLASVTRKRVPSYQSSLRFDFDWCSTFCVPLQDHEVYEQHPCSCFYDVKFQFVRSVNQYLDAYKGTNILLFKVSFCLGNGFSDDIDQWISFAIKMGIEELVLELQCEKNRPTPTTNNNILELDKQMEGNYVLQGDLFEGATTKLKHLHLVACSIGTNFTQHFNFLETLTLAASPLAQYDIHSLFSCMVNLKQLFLERCTLPVKLCLGSLLLLNRFYIKCRVGIKEIELSNANLLYIDFTTTETILSNLSGVPNLERLGYSVDGRMMRNIFTNDSKHLPKLTALTVYCPDDWVQCVPESINVFCNVDYLLLFITKETKFDILKMVSILGAFPSLRRFVLNMRCPKDTEQEEKLLQRSEYVPKHLQYVEIKGFHGTPNQIEFTIHLLKHTSTLKKLVIKHEFLSVKRQSWDEGERQMVYQRLQEFSKDVKLIVQ